MPNGQEKIRFYDNPNNKEMYFMDLTNSDNSNIGKVTLLINLNNKMAYLQSIFIEGEYTSQQYGTLLKTKIFEICDENGIEKLYLWSDTVNNPTVNNFYNKLGFTYINDLDLIQYNFEINISEGISKNKEFIRRWSNIIVQNDQTNSYNFRANELPLLEITSSNYQNQYNIDEIFGGFDELPLLETIDLVELSGEDVERNIGEPLNQQSLLTIENDKKSELVSQKEKMIKRKIASSSSSLSSQSSIISEKSSKKIKIEQELGVERIEVLNDSLLFKSTSDGMNSYYEEYQKNEAKEKQDSEQEKQSKPDPKNQLLEIKQEVEDFQKEYDEFSKRLIKNKESIKELKEKYEDFIKISKRKSIYDYSDQEVKKEINEIETKETFLIEKLLEMRNSYEEFYQKTLNKRGNYKDKIIFFEEQMKTLNYSSLEKELFKDEIKKIKALLIKFNPERIREQKRKVISVDNKFYKLKHNNDKRLANLIKQRKYKLETDRKSQLPKKEKYIYYNWDTESEDEEPKTNEKSSKISISESKLREIVKSAVANENGAYNSSSKERVGKKIAEKMELDFNHPETQRYVESLIKSEQEHRMKQQIIEISETQLFHYENHKREREISDNRRTYSSDAAETLYKKTSAQNRLIVPAIATAVISSIPTVVQKSQKLDSKREIDSSSTSKLSVISEDNTSLILPSVPNSEPSTPMIERECRIRLQLLNLSSPPSNIPTPVTERRQLEPCLEQSAIFRPEY